MTPFAHTGSNFEKLLKREICRRKSSTHWRKLRINIAYSSKEIKLFNDVIRAYRKFFRESCWSLIDAEFSPLFTGVNCALILLIVAEKSNFEIIMTSFAHTGSTFEKIVFKRYVWNLILYFCHKLLIDTWVIYI